MSVSGQAGAAPAPPEVLHYPWSETDGRRIARALQGGAVLTFPTETVFGLGGNALDARVHERVYALKGRPRSKAMLLLVDGVAGLARLAGDLPPAAEQLITRFWPGPLTLVVPAHNSLPRHLVDARGTVAVRWSPHPLVQVLLALGGVPLIGTSANPSGGGSLTRLTDVLVAFPQGLDLALDGGTPEAGVAPGSAPSTLVDTTVTPPRVLREGAITTAELAAALEGPITGPREA